MNAGRTIGLVSLLVGIAVLVAGNFAEVRGVPDPVCLCRVPPYAKEPLALGCDVPTGTPALCTDPNTLCVTGTQVQDTSVVGKCEKRGPRGGNCNSQPPRVTSVLHRAYTLRCPPGAAPGQSCMCELVPFGPFFPVDVSDVNASRDCDPGS